MKKKKKKLFFTITMSAANEYVPKNILVTGAAGFIGSHVVLRLAAEYPQYKIVALDKMDYCTSPNNLEAVSSLDNFKFVEGNILSTDLVRYLLESEAIDTIMHFAAQSHVDNSFGNSIEFTENNVLGTHVLLEASKRHGIKRFIHVSTDEVYGETSETMKEDMVLAPTNPYAASKAAAEFIVKSYYRSFALPTIITRGNNVYGPHQYPEKLIPKFISLLERGRPCCIHGTGVNTRNFVFVEDVARAFVALLHQGVVGEVYNIGTDFEVSNVDVARKLIELFDRADDADTLITYVADRQFNDERYHIDVSKMAALGWQPQVGWDEGLRRTIDWYRANPDHWGVIDSALEAHPVANSSFPKSGK
jgi:UDP-glucose 4,6-dehydratase